MEFKDEWQNILLNIKSKRRGEADEFRTKLLDAMDGDRILASEACKLITEKSATIPDPLMPIISRVPPVPNKFVAYREFENNRGQKVSCCTIM